MSACAVNIGQSSIAMVPAQANATNKTAAYRRAFDPYWSSTDQIGRGGERERGREGEREGGEEERERGREDETARGREFRITLTGEPRMRVLACAQAL